MQLFKLICGAALAAFATFNSVAGFAQGAYIKVGGGYNAGIGNSFNQYSRDITLHNDYTSTVHYKAANISLGKGWSFNGAAGYMLSKYIGAELGIGYLNRTHKVESNLYGATYGVSGTINYEVNAPLLLIQPSLVITTGTEKIRPVAKFGLVTSTVEIREKEVYSFWTDKEEWERKTSGNRAWGFQGSLGTELKVSERVHFSAGVTFSNLYYQPEKAVLTRYKYNGESVLDQIPMRIRQINFVDSIVENKDREGNIEIREDQPGERLKVSIPINSMGLEFGLKFNL